MTFNSYPWDGGPNMAESEWRELWRAQEDGFTSVGSLTLSASNGDVTLSGARGRIQGAAFIQSGSDTVTLTAVPGGQQRIDVAVLRYNPTNNTVTPVIVTGTPAASSPQRPLLEPHRSGGSLLSGLYDLPFVTFSGAAGTAAVRGTNIRPRITRSFFASSSMDYFAIVNERHGDFSYREDGVYWFDSNAGSSGTWKPIWAHNNETACGSQTNVAFNSNGEAIIDHNLEWTPTYMNFIHDGEHNTSSVNFSIRWLDSSRVGIHGRSMAGNVPYTGSLARVRWIAHRNP